MNKPSTTPTPKVSTQPPRKPARAKGTPQPEALISASSKSTLSPASPPEDAANQPIQTSSKRSSSSGQKGVTKKTGINVPSSDNVGPLKSNSVTSGSIDKGPAILPPPPTNVSLAKTEVVKSSRPRPVENRGSIPLPSPRNQRAGRSSLKQSGLTSNPPLPPTISPAAAKLIAPSLPNTDASTSKANVPALSPTPSRKSKKLAKKSTQKLPPSPLSTVSQKNFDSLPPAPSSSHSTAVPTPSPGAIPFSQDPQDNVSTLSSGSCLATASTIEDLGHISYPEGVMSPKPELNVNSEKGKFKYDREFLLQFMPICTERPGVPLGILYLDFSTRTSNMTDQTTPAQGVPRKKRTRTKRAGGGNKPNEDKDTTLEPAVPPEVSGDGGTKQSPADGEHDLERKVRALLNKLTVDKFDTISNQIVAWANKSETEKDCQSLVHVTRLVYENAVNGATWSGIYARLCKKMIETINPNIQDDSARSADGKPIAGGQLFQKYLMDRCSKDFICGWAARMFEDFFLKKALEGPPGSRYTDKLHRALKAKRRRLGLVQFYGELYKLEMSTEQTVHECIRNLLNAPGMREFESIYQLLMTVGKLLDSPNARADMDCYFARMKEFEKIANVPPRLKFIVQDLTELRERKWVPKCQVGAQTVFSVKSKPPKQEGEATGGSGEHLKARGGDEPPRASLEDEVDKKIEEDVKELFSARDIDESEDYFNKLPSERRHRLVCKMASKAIESREADGRLVAEAFARAAEKKLCTTTAFEEGFLHVAGFLDDAVIDAPKAFQIMAILMKGAGLDKDVERRVRVAQKSTNGDKLLELIA